MADPRRRSTWLSVPVHCPTVTASMWREGCVGKHYYAAGYGFTPRPCRVDECQDVTDPKTGDGLCQNHYARVRRHGDVTALRYFPRKTQALADVLLERSEPHGDCILWTGKIREDGYGAINGDRWGTTVPHRFSYLLAFGPIPDGHEVDHLCHNEDADCVPSACLHRRCVNPEHLEAVSHDENMRRQFARLNVAS